MIVQWYFLDTGRGFFIFFLVPGCFLLDVAASIMRRDVFVHYHLLTRSFTNEGEKEGGRGIGIGYVELDANWHATLARYSIYMLRGCTWLPYADQWRGREGEGERYSLIRKKKKTVGDTLSERSIHRRRTVHPALLYLCMICVCNMLIESCARISLSPS